jgi:hypothetical protein
LDAAGSAVSHNREAAREEVVLKFDLHQIQKFDKAFKSLGTYFSQFPTATPEWRYFERRVVFL